MNEAEKTALWKQTFERYGLLVQFMCDQLVMHSQLPLMYFSVIYTENQKLSSTKKHRRSRSAEMPSIIAQDSSTWTDTDYRTSDYSPPVPDSDITGKKEFCAIIEIFSNTLQGQTLQASYH